jgi:hypothetical protein
VNASNAVATMNAAAQLRPVPDFEITREQVELIKRTVMPNASDLELDLFINLCRAKRLDPLTKQIYAIKPQSSGWQFFASIDGLRVIAQRSGDYLGQTAPYWCGMDGVWRDVWLMDGAPAAAKVGVWKRGNNEPTWGVATFRSYGVGKKNNWLSMPDVMLAKCFSEDTEVLTDRGFQHFSDISGRILQVTARGLEPTEALPFSQDYTGPMVSLESDDLNFSVTPNHDMLTTEGKIEAGSLYARARTRPKHWIPRCISGSQDAVPISDQELRLAAAYLADGSDMGGGRFKIEVSRPKKVQELTEIGGFVSRGTRKSAGDVSHASVRTIVTKSDKQRFVYDRESAGGWLVEEGKRVRVDRLLRLSRDQARVFVDALVAFDGTVTNSGTRRFYTSRPDHAEAFEVAAVVAGCAVSPRRPRTSDISNRPNYVIAISGRSEIPVVRWGQSYHNVDRENRTGRTGLEISPNATNRVWCVTVASGVIVVRRNGFSMQCGNCAEALALRKAFPDDLSGLYVREEFTEADAPVESVRTPPQPRIDVVEAAVRGVPVADAIEGEVIDDDAGEIAGQQSFGAIPENGEGMIDASQRGQILFLARKLGWLTENRKDVNMLAVNGFCAEMVGISNLDLLSNQRAAYVIEQMEGQIPGKARAS